MGLIYCLVGGTIMAVGGGVKVRAAGVSIPILLGLYITCGLISGLVFALFAPLTKRRIGAMLVGFLAAVPALSLVVYALRDAGLRPGDAPIVTLITAALLGPAFGARIWEPVDSSQKKRL